VEALTTPAPELEGRSARRRQAVLDAALHCFTTDGYEATRIEDIRVRSGASIGSIYHHFGSKERIAAALYLEAIRSYQDELARAIGPGTPAEQGVREIAQHHLHWVGSHPDLARYLLTRRPPEVELAMAKELREANRAFMAPLLKWIRAKADEGAMRPLSADLFHALVLGPAQEFARHWLAGRMKTSIDEAEPVLLDAIWASVRQPKESKR
jgi:AcrR family transcriptional regulator